MSEDNCNVIGDIVVIKDRNYAQTSRESAYFTQRK